MNRLRPYRTWTPLSEILKQSMHTPSMTHSLAFRQGFHTMAPLRVGEDYGMSNFVSQYCQEDTHLILFSAGQGGKHPFVTEY
jgi:hypothetical protein